MRFLGLPRVVFTWDNTRLATPLLPPTSRSLQLYLPSPPDRARFREKVRPADVVHLGRGPGFD